MYVEAKYKVAWVPGFFSFYTTALTDRRNMASPLVPPHSRRENGVAAGWHSRPGFDVFSKTAQDPTNEKHHLLSQVLNDAFL